MSCKLKTTYIIPLLILASCSAKLSPKATAPLSSPSKLLASQEICFKKPLSFFKEYFEGQSNLKKINQFWMCLNKTVEMSETYIDFNLQGQITYEDIILFSQKTLGEKHIDPNLFNLMFSFKELFFYQSKTSILKKDLQRLRMLFGQLHQMMISLQSQKQILFATNEEHRPSYKNFETAKNVLLKNTKKLGQLLKNYGVFLSNETVLLILKNFFPQSPNNDRNYKKVREFIVAIKNIVIFKDPLGIRPAHWPLVTSLLGKQYAVYLRAKLFIHTSQLNQVETLWHIKEAVDEMFLILSESLSYKTHPLKIEEISRLIKIGSDIFTSLTIQEKNVTHVLTFLVQNLSSQKDKRVFDIDFLKDLRNLALQTLFTQNTVLNHLKISKKNLLESEFISRQKPLAYGPLPYHRMDFSKAQSTFHTLTKTPLFFSRLSEENIILLTSHKQQKTETYRQYLNITLLNIEHSLLKLFFEKSGSKKGLTLEGIGKIFEQVKDFFMDLGVVIGDSKKIPQTLFRESNVFMPSSKIDEFTSPLEALEYAHYLLNAFLIQRHVFDKKYFSCRSLNRRNKKTYLQKCVYEYLKNIYPSFKFLPHFQKQWGQLPQARRDLFSKRVAIASGLKKTRYIGTGDIFKMFMILQYIETLLVKFDEDKNGSINYKESLNFFPYAYFALQNTLPEISMKELETLYTYLLHTEKKEPVITDPLLDLKLIDWELREQKLIDAQFADIIDVFYVLRQLSL